MDDDGDIKQFGQVLLLEALGLRTFGLEGGERMLLRCGFVVIRRRLALLTTWARTYRRYLAKESIGPP